MYVAPQLERILHENYILVEGRIGSVEAERWDFSHRQLNIILSFHCMIVVHLYLGQDASRVSHLQCVRLLADHIRCSCSLSGEFSVFFADLLCSLSLSLSLSMTSYWPVLMLFNFHLVSLVT